jgi:ADP-ribose pyrophosphatase YjhB (NUDIX family)
MIIAKSLYQKIKSSVPISTVDLVVMDRDRRILLLKRNNLPAQGEWWFPGGRVHYHELRTEAARRKLKEECGIKISNIQEIGAFDIIFKDCRPSFHVITTVFLITAKSTRLKLDSQSEVGEWKTYKEWEKTGIHSFVEQSILSAFSKQVSKQKIKRPFIYSAT